jgi:hypothetical protein
MTAVLACDRDPAAGSATIVTLGCARADVQGRNPDSKTTVLVDPS